MDTAIKRAIEGGYIPKYKNSIANVRGGYDFDKMLLDPAFWQALGKAEGCEVQAWCCPIHEIISEKFVTYEECCDLCGNNVAVKKIYMFYWHRFIDHIAEGKSVDDFFNQLLK